MRNGPFEESPFRDLSDRVSALLPKGWAVTVRRPPDRRPGTPDAALVLTAPDGETVTLDIAAKRWTTAPTSAVAGVLASLRSKTANPVLLFTDYANAPLREVCEALDISYVDSTGWAYINLERPAVFIRAEGARRGSLVRRTHEVTRLNGRAAGRLIRTLLTVAPPIGVRELAHQANTSPSSAAKLLPTLAREGAVERDESGRVTVVRRRLLLDRWTADYSFLNSNGIVLDFVAPRGLPRLHDQLSRTAGVCVTGSAAARTFLPPAMTPVAPITLLTLYAQDPLRVADQLALVRTDRSTSNVLVAAPMDPQIVDQPQYSPEGLPRAPLGLVLADLLSLPGRSAQEAEQIMNALATDDPSWE